LELSYNSEVSLIEVERAIGEEKIERSIKDTPLAYQMIKEAESKKRWRGCFVVRIITGAVQEQGGTIHRSENFKGNTM
jgi:hypothetical protein